MWRRRRSLCVWRVRRWRSIFRGRVGVCGGRGSVVIGGAGWERVVYIE